MLTSKHNYNDYITSERLWYYINMRKLSIGPLFKCIFALVILLVTIIIGRAITSHEIPIENIASSSTSSVNKDIESHFNSLAWTDKVTGETIFCFEDFYSASPIWYAFLPSYYEESRFEMVCLDSDIERYDMSSSFSCDEYTEYDVDFIKNNTVCESGKLRLMCSKYLPTVYIYIYSGNSEYINSDKNNFENVRTTITDEVGNTVYMNDSDIISGHGNRSWTFPKKSYGLKFQVDVPLFNMGASKNYVLLSNVCDSSKVQNAITYEMAAESGMAFSPKFQYVDLYLNGIYWGNYLLCEKVEIGEGRIPLNDLSKINEELNPILIDGVNGDAEYYQSEVSKGFIVDHNPSDISGAYLIERDYDDKYNEEPCGFITDILGEKYVLKNPNNASKEEVEYISNYINNFEAALISDDDSYTNFIDITSFADKYIVEEITQNRGAGTTSAFYYKPQDSVSTHIYAGPVWDYDTAYFESPNQLAFSALHPLSPTSVYYMLYQKPDFKEAVCEEYTRFFSDYLSLMPERINYYYSLNNSSFNMDMIRWGNDPYEPRIEYDINYIGARKQFLDDIWINNVPICTVHFIDEEGNRNWNYSVKEGDTLKTPRQQISTWENEITGEIFDETLPILQDQTYIAVTDYK